VTKDGFTIIKNASTGDYTRESPVTSNILSKTSLQTTLIF